MKRLPWLPIIILSLGLDGCSPPDPATGCVNSAGRGDTQKLSALIREGVDVNAQSVRHLGWTPLIAAIYHKQQRSVDMLIDSGADVNKPDTQGQTPLFWCVTAWPENTNLIANLLVRGADPNKQSSAGVSAYSAARKTPAIMDLFNSRTNGAGLKPAK
jgi:ankyrin repeat protein